ncbi:Cytochrome P450 monooxygenase [Lachnellula occidentalis]|uniref:Cytochrome P450 monooxygenase n=1 Tax=Lachnellula occidentalis TaxID=215460 RepID=A0A8H8S5Z8_9HELO|nr:Cytochrome P450 monooxygenase [Lachnellula occidentalis]
MPWLKPPFSAQNTPYSPDINSSSMPEQGHLHTDTIRKRLTPKLGVLVPLTAKELTSALKQELPAGNEEFSDFKAFHLVLRLVSHIAARHFVGSPLCSSEDWISTALKYTENAFRTIIFVRVFPNWLKPLIGFFLPYSWKVSSALKHAQQLIIPIVLERRNAESAGDATYEKPEDFLQWMMDGANEHDGEPHRLAHRLLILTLAAVHTTSMAATQTLFDLCARPEYIVPLQEEVLQAVTEDNGFQKPTLTKLRKLDSFMRESQRLNPPSLLGFKRSVKTPLTLSDGLLLPAAVHLMMPVSPLALDPAIIPNPTAFLGFRHYDLRQLPGQSTRHQFATTSSNNLHFGHGKYSRPGRFFAANSIKMVISRLLLEFDFKFPDDKMARPRNVEVHEYCFPDPDASVLFRGKKVKLWVSEEV